MVFKATSNQKPLFAIVLRKDEAEIEDCGHQAAIALPFPSNRCRIYAVQMPRR